MRKGLVISLTSISVLLASAFAVLMLYSPVPEKSSFGVSLDEIRAASLMMKGNAPDHINILSTGMGHFPPGFAIAGSFRTLNVPYYTYQVVYKNNSPAPLIVDTGMAKAFIKGIAKDNFFDDAASDTLQNSMRKASLIVLTHEHFDHIGGLAKSPYYDEIASKTILTAEQKDSRWIEDGFFAPGALEKTRTLSYQRLFPLAPGVVLVKTPGHTPGHQIVYLRLSSGKEVILAGDIGWNLDAVRIPKGRPLLTSLVLREDRTASANQLRWLNDAEKEGVTVIVTHDLERTKEEVRKGTVREGME